MTTLNRRPRALLLAAGLAAAVVLTACGSDSSTNAGTTTTATASSAAPTGGVQVLPVADNPITNTSTVDTLTIDSVLVENNVDAATGKTADDHLEIALTNTGTAPLTNFEVFYTFTDSTTNTTEHYYLALPDAFTMAPGASRVTHVDNSGAPGHFPANEYSLYTTSSDQLGVTVTVSARDAKPVTATVTKDASGAEQAD